MKLFVAVLAVLVGGTGLANGVYAADPAAGRALARQCQTCHSWLRQCLKARA